MNFFEEDMKTEELIKKAEARKRDLEHEIDQLDAFIRTAKDLDHEVGGKRNSNGSVRGLPADIWKAMEPGEWSIKQVAEMMKKVLDREIGDNLIGQALRRRTDLFANPKRGVYSKIEKGEG